MVPGYEKVLERFKMERLKHNYNQNDVCHKINMSQSQFSKAENGEKRFTYEHIRKLYQMGYDIHYIYILL